MRTSGLRAAPMQLCSMILSSRIRRVTITLPEIRLSVSLRHVSVILNFIGYELRGKHHDVQVVWALRRAPKACQADAQSG